MTVGVVLAAGEGSRMRGAGGYPSKVLIPVDGVTLIRRAMAHLAPFVNRFDVVVAPGPRGHAVQMEVGLVFQGRPVRYVEQAEQKGPIGALKTVVEDMVAEPALTVMADEYFVSPDIGLMIGLAGAWGADGALGVVPDCPPEDVSENYSVRTDGRGFVDLVVEKPPVSAVGGEKGTGLCYITPVMARLLCNVPDDRTLADWYNAAVGKGMRLIMCPVAREEYNVNTPDILARLVEDESDGQTEHM